MPGYPSIRSPSTDTLREPAPVVPAPVLGNSGRLALVAETYRGRLLGQMRTYAVAGFTAEQYRRLLSAHWHLLASLAQGAFAVAGHDWARTAPSLRTPLLRLGLRWEAARALANDDLLALKLAPGPLPVDVHLWRMHFMRQIDGDLPSAFIGAAAIQDQFLSGSVGDAMREALGRAGIPAGASRCLQRLMSDAGEHFEPLWNGLDRASTDATDDDALWLGARVAGLMLLRLYHACLDDDCPSHEIEALLDPEAMSD
ncbi:MAG: hypothetical protein R3E83_09415 [Burkholderiaceae bacterium]